MRLCCVLCEPSFHVDSLAISRFARSYSAGHMLAYVDGVQRPEAAEAVATLTHQKWSGAELADAEVHAVTGGAASTAAMGHGNTEQQFASGAHNKLTRPSKL